MEIEKIAIYIPDEEAKKFILFQKHYNLFCLLLEKGVFEQKSGSVSLNFDYNGVLQTIQRSDFLYSRKFDEK